MSLKITGGIFRSRIIDCPKQGVRPTTNRVKEALFSTIGQNLSGCHVLDLFAGSGNLGFEALSRGAEHITFVEKSRKHAQIIRKNIQGLGVTDVCSLEIRDAISFAESCQKKFDLIFMDPPYNIDLVSKTAGKLYNLLTEDGILVIEHSPSEAVGMPVWRSRSYGDSVISYIRREPDA